MSVQNYLKSKIFRRAIRKSAQSQIKHRLHDLKLWELEINDRGHITVDSLDVIDLAQQYGSPLLVVNKKQLVNDARRIQGVLADALPGSKVLYSYKTNCVPGILREIHDLEIGAEVISPYELWLAEKLEVPESMIVYNGVNKTDESLIRAIRGDIASINIDHGEEIERIYRIAKKLERKARVGIRLGLTSSQFGLDMKSGEAMDACRKIASMSDFLDLVCIHFNVTSNAKSAVMHKICALAALQFMAEIKNELGLTIPYLDIGGGFGVPTTKNMSGLEYGLYRMTGSLPKPPSVEECQPIESFVDEIIRGMKEMCKKLEIETPCLIIEPGRFITSRSEMLLARVHSIKTKSDGTRYAITDAGRLSITFPCDFEYHEVFVANRPDDSLTTSYNIMGRVCTSADWMFKNRCMPELRPGDILAIMDAGAYFSSYSTNFAFPRPAIVMVNDGTTRLIRKEETFEHLTAMDAPEVFRSIERSHALK